MRREVRTLSPHGAPLVELCQRKLRAAVAAGRVPAGTARVTEGHLAALQMCVRIGEISPVEAALQAAEAVGLAMGEPTEDCPHA
ncbi:hypothetical protein [Methylobacterium brachiatum]|jgi:hypothetical protein|uniref:hypothetical protein n=1 Tax=Methylobacterium brachiatum TaxID=269660 RepID=UPI00244ABE0D|nr:hypothetical protein [Methylobacterium brachiatum]MDH2310800.1 hypothetical protein [Methylobacterium brachiatum]